MVGVHSDKHAEVGIDVLVEGNQGVMVDGILVDGMLVDGMLVDEQDQ